MKITLKCPEGFTYHSWQRIECYDEEGRNISLTVTEKLNSSKKNAFGDSDCPPVHFCSYPVQCLFVLSGESFTLADFAALVQDEHRGSTFILMDGNEEPEEWKP